MFGDQLRFLTNASFRFVITVDGMPAGAFTDCTLPSLELELEEVKEGGLNTYTHQLPGRRKSARVSLKNGVGLLNQLLPWYIKSMNEQFSRRRVTITLFSALIIPIMVWDIEDAYPVKWVGPDLQSGSNSVAIQTLELACGAINVL
jgi:phage tail-like protein